MTAPAKIRLDQYLALSGLVPSRERARALILAGRILVNEQKIDKPGALVASDAALRLLGELPRYVSRGGLKLEHALRHWQIPLTDRDCLDIGTSTGGFTDCLLQHGARSVTCVDTGFGQIAISLRSDPRVHLLERTNARLLAARSFARTSQQNTPVPTLLVMDVSFISATLLLPAVLAAAPEVTEAVILVKPQFEVGRERIGKGGIVRDPAAHQFAVHRVTDCITELRATSVETTPSPITGAEGNVEFLLHACFVSRGNAQIDTHPAPPTTPN